MENIIIIGGGQAAFTFASEIIKGNNKNFKLTIITKENHPPYQRPPLSKKFLQGELEEKRLYFKSIEYFNENNIDLILKEEIISINVNEQKVNSKSKQYYYDYLVIATGSKLNKLRPEISKEIKEKTDLLPVSFKNINDAKNLQKEISKKKRLLIIGGGYIGLEIAASMNKFKKETHIFEIEDQLMKRNLAKPVSDYFLSLHKGYNVKINLGCDFSKDENFIKLCDKDAIVIAGIGTKAETIECNDKINMENGYLTDKFTKTNIENIFAIGDCSNYFNQFYQKNIRSEIVATSIFQAKILANYLLGKESDYNFVPWFWSDQYDKKLQYAGMKIENEENITKEEDNKFVNFTLSHNKINSIAAINDPISYMVGKKLIEKNIEIEKKLLEKTSLSNIKNLLELL